MSLPYAYYSQSTKGFYITELGYKTYPEDVIAIAKEEHEFYLSQLNGNNKSIIVSNGAIELVERETPPLTWEFVREYRNNLLKESDYTQLPDFPEAKKAEWATYRQALRDIPQTYATPEEVIWPTKPT